MVTAIARALGRGDRERAGNLVWGALSLAIALGSLATAAVLWFGPAFYEGMGARGASLSAALVYSHLVFSGAVLIWTFNLMLAAVRGTGNMTLPLVVVCGGAIVLIPLSALLIFGYSHFPALGVRGGAIAVLLYYLVGTLIFIFHLWGRSSVLRPSYAPPRFDWEPIREILRVGGLSAIVSSTTIGYAMYCVGQGTGGMKWPVAGACVRTAVAVLGGLGCLYLGAGVHSIFLAVAIGMASFGSLALPGLIRQSEFSRLPIASARRLPPTCLPAYEIAGTLLDEASNAFSCVFGTSKSRLQDLQLGQSRIRPFEHRLAGVGKCSCDRERGLRRDSLRQCYRTATFLACRNDFLDKPKAECRLCIELVSS